MLWLTKFLPVKQRTIMVNYQIRVFVTHKKKTLFERILSPENSLKCDAQEVFTGLRQLFPHEATITIEAYGV